MREKQSYLIDPREKLAYLIVSDLPKKDQIANSEAAGKLADHLIANGVTIGGSDLIPEVITDRIICDSDGKFHHQLRFKLGDRDWGISRELPEELVALPMNEQQWIPVSEIERLPKEHEKVVCRGPEGGLFIAETRYCAGRVLWNDIGHIGRRKATHWMPLPEPPKGE